MPSAVATLHRRHAKSRIGGRGFTLIECSVVLLVLAVIACAVAPGLQTLIETRRLSSAATALAADIQLARHEAVARNQPLRVSFFAGPASNCYVVHTGSASACPCSADAATHCASDAVEIKTVAWPVSEHITLQSNVASILFDPLHGTSTPTGTLRIAAAQGREIHHVINIMGRVRSCSPQAAIAGYRAC